MNLKLFYLLTLLVCSTLCQQSRSLQGWEDPFCSEWSDDGTICKKCAERTYYNSDQKKCLKVNDNCKTWNKANGDCKKCFDGYGDA